MLISAGCVWASKMARKRLLQCHNALANNHVLAHGSILARIFSKESRRRLPRRPTNPSYMPRGHHMGVSNAFQGLINQVSWVLARAAALAMEQIQNFGQL